MKSALNPHMNMLGFPWMGTPWDPGAAVETAVSAPQRWPEPAKKKRGGDFEQKYRFMMVITMVTVCVYANRS